MFKRPHHRRILSVLQALNASFLERCECFFGGGTAIVLLLDEYRESVDIDFLCASHEGYRELRSAVFHRQLAALFDQPPTALRELRADRYGIRTVLAVDTVPIKFEIVREDRIPLTGAMHPDWRVPLLSKDDMYAEKLLANADRYADAATACRDLIDLAMMVNAWGPIPKSVWQKVSQAYGDSAELALAKAKNRLLEPQQLSASLAKLQMSDNSVSEKIMLTLAALA